MASLSESPTYNLKVVVNETGIKPDTLRAWERRYGLPTPDRTGGGHRLYSDRDIATIKWLMARQEEGLSISRAVKLWRSLEAEGEFPLLVPEYQELPTPVMATAVPHSNQIDDIRAAWIDACLRFDEGSAERILTQAFALYQPETVLTKLLQRALSEIGDLWFQDKVTVQQEHFASALAMRRLNTLLAAAPAPTRSGRVLIGCPPHEDHTFASLTLTIMLRYRGWELIYLGANVPLGRFVSTVESIKPNLIILTAQQLFTAAKLFEVAKNVAAEKNVMLAFGGRIFNTVPRLRQRIPGYFLGETMEDATQTVDRLLSFGMAPPTIKRVPDFYLKALEIFRDRQALIEGSAWGMLKANGMSYEHYTNANLHLSRDIYAALTFGDIEFLSAEIAWAEKLLLNYSMPVEAMRQYLQAYHQAAQENLTGPAEIVVDWLAEVAQNPALTELA
ncbi:MAG: MerR family transcriptional regulator [Ardenticatenaceae bacterium]|nr:MerR family transcriptional regulator [Anaerolineales bacterium]MCB8981357.1 MerR family transcriptional regulator [Ardenticatenaceae bacterium]